MFHVKFIVSRIDYHLYKKKLSKPYNHFRINSHFCLSMCNSLKDKNTKYSP